MMLASAVRTVVLTMTTDAVLTLTMAAPVPEREGFRQRRPQEIHTRYESGRGENENKVDLDGVR